jgi:uracil-DNA glycosylase family 4
VALRKRRAYRDQEYWGRPVPPFGAADPRLLVVGLAPGAHGANRTGRVFTGDSSGDWLYRALHRAGFANRPESTRRGDGLALAETAVTCVVRCAPPRNRPAREELLACRPWLVEEIRRYGRLRAVVALGRVAFEGVLRAFEEAGREPFAPRTPFRHGARLASGEVALLLSYHPSRQNTQTGRLTRAMLDGVFARARRILGR